MVLRTMYTCVIADSSTVFREEFHRMLSEHNKFNCVFAAATARAALQACTDYQPDFIVVDDRISDQSPFELVSLLSAAIDPAPLVIGTSLFNEESAQKAFLAVGALFIPKKLLMSVLPDQLTELLDIHASKGRP